MKLGRIKFVLVKEKPKKPSKWPDFFKYGQRSVRRVRNVGFNRVPNEERFIRMFGLVHHKFDHQNDTRWKNASHRMMLHFPKKCSVGYANKFSVHRFC